MILWWKSRLQIGKQICRDKMNKTMISISYNLPSVNCMAGRLNTNFRENIASEKKIVSLKTDICLFCSIFFVYCSLSFFDSEKNPEGILSARRRPRTTCRQMAHRAVLAQPLYKFVLPTKTKFSGLFFKFYLPMYWIHCINSVANCIQAAECPPGSAATPS